MLAASMGLVASGPCFDPSHKALMLILLEDADNLHVSFLFQQKLRLRVFSRFASKLMQISVVISPQGRRATND